MIENFINILRSQNYDFNKKMVILDIGSRDCVQSIEFTKYFPNSTIYAFECNPNTLDICKSNIKNYNNIKLIEGAINDYNGECKFYPINKEKTITTWQDGNPGASSLFIATGNYPHETYFQDEITINCHRVDTVLKNEKIDKVDLIWMDLQGAELLALNSMGSILHTVDYIHTEVSYQKIYNDQVLFPELNKFLIDNNFISLTLSKHVGWQEDIIYKNKTL
jgi:FkbM family methyltransferase